MANYAALTERRRGGEPQHLLAFDFLANLHSFCYNIYYFFITFTLLFAAIYLITIVRHGILLLPEVAGLCM